MSEISRQRTLEEPLTLRLDISGQVEGLHGQASIAVTIYLPSHEAFQDQSAPVLVTLIHGGTYTRRYWDLVVPGYGRDEYSFARYLTRQGYCVLALDLLGMGESYTALNGFDLKTIMMAQAIVVATEKVRGMLDNGELVSDMRIEVAFSVLVGHSMGGYLAALAQATFPFFDAIVLQSQVGGAKKIAGIDESAKKLFAPDANGYVGSHRDIFFPFFHGRFPPPRDVVAWDDAQAVPTPVTLFTEVFERKGPFSEWARRIDIPLLLTFGESDSVVDPLGELDLYPATPSRSVYIHKGSAHCNNFAPTRFNLWRVLAQFIAWSQAFAGK